MNAYYAIDMDRVQIEADEARADYHRDRAVHGQPDEAVTPEDRPAVSDFGRRPAWPAEAIRPGFASLAPGSTGHRRDKAGRRKRRKVMEGNNEGIAV